MNNDRVTMRVRVWNPKGRVITIRVRVAMRVGVHARVAQPLL